MIRKFWNKHIHPMGGVFLLSPILLAAPVYGQALEVRPLENALDSDSDQTPGFGADLAVSFVSNYLDRGEDVYASRAIQEHESYGSSTGAWAFQPEVTFTTPVEGLTFDVWLSFAMEGRENQDVDMVYQRSPGGADVIGEYGNSPFQMYEDNLSSLNALSFLDYEDCKAVDSCFPGLYKEEVGLRAQDRMILTLDYGFESKLGVLNFGITSDSYLNSVGKDAATTEIYFVYGLPFLPQLTLETVMDISSSDDYFFLSYGDEHELDESLEMGVGYSLGVGYNVTSHLQGVRDVTGEVNFNIMGFFVGLEATYRPNLAFFDDDGITWQDAPMWVVGGSTTSDGLVADNTVM